MPENNQCHWCGGRFGVHSDRCDVPRRAQAAADVAAREEASRAETGTVSLKNQAADA